MPEDVPAAEVAFDEYPNVDFTPRFPFPLNNGHSPKPTPRPHWFLRFYRMLRKLVRQRQESAAMRSARDGCSRIVNREFAKTESEIASVRAEAAKEVASIAKRLESRDKALSELQQKMDRTVEQLQQTIAAREKDIKNHVELEIPKLKRELQVAAAHVNYLEALLEKKLSYQEAEIALHNKLVVDSETASDQLRQSAFMAERGR